jgi:Transposase DDE domain
MNTTSTRVPGIHATIARTVTAMFAGTKLHAKQIESVSQAVLGAMMSPSAGVSAVGRAAAAARGKEAKHGIKQVDRFLSNRKVDDLDLVRQQVAFVVGSRSRIVLTMDWTEYGLHGQNRLAINLVTRHGRATPLIWKTVPSAELKGQMAHQEVGLLRILKAVLPASVKQVIILADRGFGDVDLYDHIQELGFDFVIRFRGVILVTAPDGHTAPASGWVPLGGRIRRILNARLTGQRHQVAAFVAVKQVDMKEAWLLATSLTNAAKGVVALYGRRFTCEENFRDEKDPRFGLGSRLARVRNAARRDRLCFILALATALLTLLGAAGEHLGLDRLLRANTVKRRTHSLFRQGREYLRMLSTGARRLLDLLRAFHHLLRRQPLSRATFGQI